MKRTLAIRAALFSLTFSLAAPALAQRDPVAAEALFREGRAAADAGNLPVACSKFKASYELEPTLGTLFNLADCEERLGRLAAAWQHFHQLLDQLPASDDRRPHVQSHSAQIEPRVPRLRVVLHKPDDPKDQPTVSQDGVVLGEARLGVSLPVDPGSHRVVVSAPDHTDKSFDVTLAEGEHKDLEVSMGSAIVHPVAPPPAPPPPPKRSPLRTVGFIVGGAGLASAAVGAIFGGLALSDNGKSNAQCTGSVCASQDAVTLHERAKTEALVADITIFGGAALVATGVVLFLVSRPKPNEGLRVAPAIGPASAGVALSGVF